MTTKTQRPLKARAAILAACLAAMAVTAPAPVFADAADDAIQARRGYFRMMAINFGPLVGMAKGEVDYDAAVAAQNARNLELLGVMRVSNLFPEGTDNAAKPGATRALPAMWADDGAGVLAKAKAFTEASAALAAAAPQGLDALRPAVGALGKTCGSCHDDYRAKDF